MLSVVADAVTTPNEAIQRAAVGPGDLAIFVGAGGIGGFGVQIAAALGATVVAIDVSEERLELARAYGATMTLDAKTDGRSIRNAIRSLVKETGAGILGPKIFETSGTTAGQATAFNLLDFGAYLAIVGYTAEKAEVRLSNLMAYDATARGNWGCAPANYPKALRLVLEGRVKLGPFIEMHPLAEIPDLLCAAARHEIRRRAVVVPDGRDPMETP
jgi:6-hydroxycyclohex-1-ene-1-carbonyl-CoA dehydrogenase